MKNEDIEKNIKAYMAEFSSQANNWFQGKRNILPIIKDYYSFHKKFFTKENLEKADWADFQQISKKLHSLSSVPMAAKNAFGVPNVAIEEYRQQFSALLNKNIPVKEKIDNFKLPYIGKAALRELMGYLFPENCYIVNSSTEKALSYLGVEWNTPRGASLGEEYEVIIKELDKIQLLYKSVVGQKTDLPINLEIDQFLYWIADTKIIKTEIKYWAVGADWKDNGSQEDRFLQQGIWEDGYGVSSNEKYRKLLEQISVGDILLMKSASTKGSNHKISFTKLKRIGKVTHINSWYSFGVEWLNIQGLPKDFENVTYRPTIQRMRNDEMLHFAKNMIEGIPYENKPNGEKTIVKHPLNQILYGPPGTGKTYSTVIKAMEIIDNAFYLNTSEEEYAQLKKKFDELRTTEQIKFITFHQNYSYEEFIEGITPDVNNKGTLSYVLGKGPLKRIAEKAAENPDKKYILIIDEINRGNISKIFGELITLLEEDKRAGNNHAISMPLMYSKEDFSLPNNLYIVGTMNTADKSIALVDVALRRRFAFIEMMPKADLIAENIDGIMLQDIFETLNKRITILLDRDHQIGHSYFMKVQNISQLKQKWFKEIQPLLNEYFYGDWEKIKLLLSDSFIKEINEPSLKETVDGGWTFKEETMPDGEFINDINNIKIKQ
jgi:hypothetical protein